MEQNGNGMEKVVLKVRKLLALAGEGNPERAEAEAAMLKAQEMLLQYGLSMEGIQFANEEQEKKEVVQEGFAWGNGRKLQWWMKSLASVLAGNFRCYIYILNGYQKKVVFIGLKRDVEVVGEVYKFAVAFGVTNWNKYRAQNYMKDYAQGVHSEKRFTTKTKNDYFDGYIKGIQDKFIKQVQSKALIILKDVLVTEAYAKMHLRSAARQSIAMGGRSGAYDKGYADGKACERGRYIEK